MKQPFFLKRIPESQKMSLIESKVFTKYSKQKNKTWLIPLIDFILEHVSFEHRKIADVGCGAGFLVRKLAYSLKNNHIIGFDVSNYSIKSAKKNCQKLKNVSFYKASVEMLPAEDNTFDLVICKDSFHHFIDPVRSIYEMLRITRKGGVVYLQDLKRDMPLYLIKRTYPPKTIFQKIQISSTRASYTTNEVKLMLQNLNIKNFSIFTRKITKKIKKRYEKQKIDMRALRESFQSRYIALIKK